MDLLEFCHEEHILHLQREVLWAGRGDCHGLTHQPNCGKPLYGKVWNQSPTVITKPPFIVEEVCWWHLCHHQEMPQRRIPDPTGSQWTRTSSSLQKNQDQKELYPFLDILIKLDNEGRLNTTVYRKPTHTDQYLHWDSLHPISSKCSMVGTLHHRAKTVCSTKQLLKEEEEHLAMALKNCNYPTWALNRIKIKMNNLAHKRNKNKTGPTQQNNIPKPFITVPYYKGLSESVKKRCSNYWV